MTLFCKRTLGLLATMSCMLVMSSHVVATQIIAIDGNTAPTYATTAQNNIWNGIDPTSPDPNNPLPGTDPFSAVNGFTAHANDPSRLPLGGDPNAGTAFLDLAGGPGENTTGRGTVYAFDVAPGIYQMVYDASWGTGVLDAIVDAYIYDTSNTNLDDPGHRMDFITGNSAFYGAVDGITPLNAGSLAGVDLIFDNGVMTGAQSLSATSAPFTIGTDDLAIFRMLGRGFTQDASATRLNVLKLVQVPEPSSLIVLAMGVIGSLVTRGRAT